MNFKFTDGADLAENREKWKTWRVGYSRGDQFRIDTGKGDDKIIGRTNPDYPSPYAPDRENGFKNRGIIVNPEGSLTIEGYAYPSNVRTNPPEPSYGFVNETLVVTGNPDTRSGIILSGDGNDRLYGYAKSAVGELAWGMYLGSQPDYSAGQIVGISEISLGGGDDMIEADSFADNARSHGIHVNWAPSKVSMDEGNDRFLGRATTKGNGWAVGIKIERGAKVELGSGDDHLEGTGTSTSSRGWGIQIVRGGILNAGDGNDVVFGEGKGPDRKSAGIINQRDGQVLLGVGNDIIRGSADHGVDIQNHGTIDTGDGDDQLLATEGGFGGAGLYLLGAGNDTVKGFGRITVDGGTGNDRLLLGQGNYIVSACGVVTRVGKKMMLKNFELIGGLSGGVFKLGAGRITVNKAGAATSSTLKTAE